MSTHMTMNGKTIGLMWVPWNTSSPKLQIGFYFNLIFLSNFKVAYNFSMKSLPLEILLCLFIYRQLPSGITANKHTSLLQSAPLKKLYIKNRENFAYSCHLTLLH